MVTLKDPPEKVSHRMRFENSIVESKRPERAGEFINHVVELRNTELIACVVADEGDWSASKKTL